MLNYIRRHNSILLWLAMAAVVAGGFHIQGNNNQHTRNLVEQLTDTQTKLVTETIGRQLDSCKTAAEFRTTFPAILSTIASSPPDVVFSQIEGFNALDSSLKAFLSSYAQAYIDAGKSGKSVLERVAANYQREFPVPDCNALLIRLNKKFGRKS